jgi:hypothetical protein
MTASPPALKWPLRPPPFVRSDRLPQDLHEDGRRATFWRQVNLGYPPGSTVAAGRSVSDAKQPSPKEVQQISSYSPGRGHSPVSILSLTNQRR